MPLSLFRLVIVEAEGIDKVFTGRRSYDLCQSLGEVVGGLGCT